MKDKQASAKHQASRCAVRPPYVARIPGCSLIALGRPERLGGSWVLPLVWFHILLLDGWADGWADGWTDMSQPDNQSVTKIYTRNMIYNIDNTYRLQLKRGLFWYRHHPNMLEMVSDRSSRADNWTDLRKMSMRIFFGSNTCTTNHKYA